MVSTDMNGAWAGESWNKYTCIVGTAAKVNHWLSCFQITSPSGWDNGFATKYLIKVKELVWESWPREEQNLLTISCSVVGNAKTEKKLE